MRGRWGVLAVATWLAALAQAQSMPQCATDCLGAALPKSTCGPTDFDCICNDAELMDSVATCSLANCTIIESLSAKNATMNLCGGEVRDDTMVTPIVTAVFGILATVAVGMRIWGCIPAKQFQWSDMCAVASLVAAYPMGILEFFMSVDGFGKDIWTIPSENITEILKFTWLTEIFYFMVMCLTKVTVLLFYLKVFSQSNIKNPILITIVISLLFGISSVVAGLCHCRPMDFGWTGWTGETQGKCFDINIFAWAHASINIVLDIWIMALPLPTLRGLQLSTRKRINLMIMFSVGIFITIVSAVRLRSFATFGNSTNGTYDNVPTATWSVLEAFVSIICSCLPAIRSVLRNVFPTCFGSSASNTSPQSYRISSKSPMPNSGIKKSVTNTVAFQQRSNESDTFELVDKDDNVSQYKGW